MKGQEKKFKIRFMGKLPDNLERLLNTFLCTAGGTNKAGIPQRGAAIRNIEETLRFYEGLPVGAEWW